jgi:hypothetical protein
VSFPLSLVRMALVHQWNECGECKREIFGYPVDGWCYRKSVAPSLVLTSRACAGLVSLFAMPGQQGLASNF